jgi:Protein of unknown function (DUF1592)/Protein of unknown function (DUF1588)/Protein of unknown function (DUF1595)/Protein of unknown function (DUF1587)
MSERIAAPRSIRSLALVAAFSVSCTGSIGEFDDPTAEPAGTDVGTGTTGGAPVANVDSVCERGETSALPRAKIWRLTSPQYVNSIRQLLGVDVPPSVLPADGITEDAITAFDTNADNAFVNDRLAGVYATQAQALAEAAVGKLSGTPQGCVLDAAATDPCIQNFIKPLATRAYRRPLTVAEMDRMVTFFKTARQTFDATLAARLMIEAILQSPYFLYRSELGNAPGAKVPLTQHELAAELAFFLTDAPPDDVLIAAADQNALSTPASVKTQADRLVATPGARAKLKDFFATVLRIDALPTTAKNATLFPTFTTALRTALQTETLTFIDKALFENQGTYETLFSADYSYQNAAVAQHYGTVVAGNEFVRTPLPPGRSGLLSQAGVLAALSSADGTSPVHRGTFFSKTLLCRPLPVPPPNASSMPGKLKDPNNPMSTQKEMFSYFQNTSPACAACHSSFQPMGLSLENFDPIGHYRDQEFNKRIDASVTVAGSASDLDGTYPDGLALGRKIATSHEGGSCLVVQYMTYAFGRSIDRTAEACRILALEDRFAQGNLNVQGLLVDMTQDDGFFFREYP